MKILYIALRVAQIVLAITVLGTASSLHSDFMKAKKGKSNTNSFKHSSDSSSSSSTSPYSPPSPDYYSYDLDPNYSDIYSWYSSEMNDLNEYIIQNIRRRDSDNNLLPRSPKRKKGSKSGDGSSSSSEDLPKPEITTGMLIAAAVLTFIFATTFAIILLATDFRSIILKIAAGPDILLSILWIAGVGLTGNVVTKYHGWDNPHRKPWALFISSFSLGFLLMILSIIITVLSLVLGLRKTDEPAPATYQQEEQAPPPQYGQEVKTDYYASPPAQQMQPHPSATPAPEQQFQQYPPPPQPSFSPAPEQQQMYPAPQPSSSPGPEQQQFYPPPQQSHTPIPEQQQYQQYPQQPYSPAPEQQLQYQQQYPQNQPPAAMGYPPQQQQPSQ